MFATFGRPHLRLRLLARYARSFATRFVLEYLRMSTTTFREAASNAIRFWEKARIGYNLVLAIVVAAYFIAALPASRSMLTVDLALGLFLLAVLANVAFCAAYPI